VIGPAPADVLIVEDDEDIRESVCDVLDDEGIAADAVGDGRAALDWLRHAAALPRVILLDLMMPGMDGAAFRRAQLADPALAGVPVVLMTANVQAIDRLGELAVDAIRKPVTLDALLSRLRRYL